MEAENQPCGYWVDPHDGRRYFIPGCYGRIHGGAAQCTCPAPARRRKVMKHVPLVDDYAALVRRLQTVMEEREGLRAKLREERAKHRALRDSLEGCLIFPAKPLPPRHESDER